MIEPLSNLDIQKRTGCKFIPYEDMYKIKDIRQLLPKTLILYQIAEIGHFTCLFLDRYGQINYFDPIGLKPDFLIDKFKLKHRKYRSHHDYDYLLYLMYKSKLPIIYNEHAYQPYKKGSNVCGHWCCVRLLYSHLTNQEFYNIFKPIMKQDRKILKFYNEI